MSVKECSDRPRVGSIALAISLTVPALCGCASILTGSSQQVTVDSNPEGAKCVIYRSGSRLQEGTTPMTFALEKSVRDLDISCINSAQREVRGKSKTSLQPWVLGNIILGGLLGIIIDFSTGAASAYDTPVMIEFDSPDAGLPKPMS